MRGCRIQVSRRFELIKITEVREILRHRALEPWQSYEYGITIATAIRPSVSKIRVTYWETESAPVPSGGYRGSPVADPRGAHAPPNAGRIAEPPVPPVEGSRNPTLSNAADPKPTRRRNREPGGRTGRYEVGHFTRGWKKRSFGAQRPSGEAGVGDSELKLRPPGGNRVPNPEPKGRTGRERRRFSRKNP